MTGANSAVGLRSMPARYLFMDEVDGYPGDVEGEGDPILLAERRSATFQRRRKIFLVSTPTKKGLSRIQREFEASDQRYYHVPCPFCGIKQPFVFKNLYWPVGKPEEATYRCSGCEILIEEYHKTTMLAQGEWITTKQGDHRTLGYHLSSLYSPLGWFSWGDAAHLFESAQKNPELMKGFVNTVLGEPFEEEYEAPEWERLYETREEYPMGLIPEGGLFLTAGVDIQKDRIECEIVAWGRNKESWSVDYHVLQGATNAPEVWKKLEAVLEKDWPHAQGQTLPIRVMAIDSGYATQEVYTWVKKYPQATWGAVGARANTPRTVTAIKGRDIETALILSVSKADVGGKKRGLRVWNISGPVAKMELYRSLKREWVCSPEGSGRCHFPQYAMEYFKQLTAERRVVRLHRGFPKAVWEKDPNRANEALDCRVYARVAATLYGLDRFTEIHWTHMEKALGEKKSFSMPASVPEPVRPVRKGLKQPPILKANDPYL
jgi:phage terminase large subunit GpA-like protein